MTPDRIADAPFSPALERALRASSRWHDGQTRKASDLPYVTHPLAVALILARLGFRDEAIAAGLLHDVVEDTEATLDDVRNEFGPGVAAIVAACSEAKRDASGAKRPWADRKRDYLEAVAAAPVEARAVALADKLHNLASLRHDLEAGRDAWSLFHADRDAVLAYYRSCIERFSEGEERLAALAGACREALAAVAGFASEKSRAGRVPG